MTDENAMKSLADNLYTYIRAKLLDEPEIRLSVKTFTATVTAAASGGKITVQRPFESTQIALPYVGSIEGATVGSVVTVAVLGGSAGSMSNAIIIGDGTLSNL